MNDQAAPHEPVSDTNISLDDGTLTLRNVAGIGLAFAALVVLAFAGGSLNVTASGVTMNVNPRH
jgi:hypothetical protein